MTFDERVQLAAPEVYRAMTEVMGIAAPDDWADTGPEQEGYRDQWRTITAALLRSAFPDLYGEKPTAWIAPWEATKPMLKAFWRTKGWFWSRMRDAQLKQRGQ